LGNLGYAFADERFQAENDYLVPKGAANRGDDGRLLNDDTRFDNYYGRLSYKVDPRNTNSLDTYKITSRKGLMYFGFPLQGDRLNHDALNIGLSWRALVGAGIDSILTANIGFNRDYFDTFDPTQNIFFRQGTLDARGLTARVEHNWQVAPIYNLRYGIVAGRWENIALVNTNAHPAGSELHPPTPYLKIGQSPTPALVEGFRVRAKK